MTLDDRKKLFEKARETLLLRLPGFAMMAAEIFQKNEWKWDGLFRPAYIPCAKDIAKTAREMILDREMPVPGPEKQYVDLTTGRLSVSFAYFNDPERIHASLELVAEDVHVTVLPDSPTS